VAGLSMGGYGAVLYAARRPRMFRATASYSGPVHLLHPQSVSAWREVFALDDYAHWLNIWGDPGAQRTVWKSHDPYHLADRLRHTPVFLSCGDGVRGPLDVTEPEPWDLTAEAFDRVLNDSLLPRLRRAGVPVETHFYRGTHTRAYWQRELHRSLPMLLDALRK
jgi:S-formylglutathione hydrolase FrmB